MPGTLPDEQPEFDASIAGQTVRTKGYRAIDLVVVLGATALVGLFWLLYVDLKGEVQRTRDQATMDHKSLGDVIKESTIAQREQTYVLTLPQGDRERLNLDMPDSLRLRLYGGDVRRPR